MTEKSELITPTLHLNGTSRNGLRSPYYDALAEVQEAIEALALVWPHARDYYVKPEKDAASRAMAQHEDRMKRLRSVEQELRWIIEGIDAQKGRGEP